MLKMNVEKTADRTILHLEGRIVNGIETTMLRKSVYSQEGASVIVLDFARVNGIDARGLGLLLELREWTYSKEIKFTLTNVSSLIQRVFEITCLDSVFEISSPEDSSSSGSPARSSKKAQRKEKRLVSSLSRLAAS